MKLTKLLQQCFLLRQSTFCFCLLFFTGCMLQDFGNWGAAQRRIGFLPAIEYYGEVAGVGNAQRRAELERLKSLSSDSLIPGIQQAIVYYHLGESEEVLDLLNFEQSRWSQCKGSPPCQDYAVLADFMSENSRLKLKSLEQIEAVQTLEDQISDLNQQIEALTTIERQILEREQRPD